jgi:phage terminase large subunit-like protein
VLRGLEVDEARLDLLPGPQRDAVVAALRELDYKRENDPLSLYFPHEKQEIFHGFTSPIKLFSGGNQSGKTTAGLADDLIQALSEEDLPSHLLPYKKFQPPFLCRIMAPSFPVLETTLYEKLQELIPTHTLAGESWGRAFDSQTRVLHFKNGSKFFFQTYEMDVSKMGGATLDRVHYDEEPPERARNECRIRVMARGGDEIFTMTPVEGLTWTYDALWKEVGGEDEEYQDSDVFERGDIQAVRVDMDDNPTLGTKEKQLALAGLSSEERQARKEGRFVALHGLIYAEFRKELHVIPAMPDGIPAHTNVVVGIDPGIRNRCAVVWMYLTHDDSMVVFDEGYYEGMTVAAVCNEIKLKNTFYECSPLYYVIDPAARNLEHQTGRSDQMEYADHGIVTIAGQNKVPAGINRIKERFEREKLFIAANCRHLIEELKQYRWKEPPRSGEDGPAKPVKKDDHLLDALRYAVMSRPYLPEEFIRDDETPQEKWMREDQENGGVQKPEQTEFGAVFA